ncbi:MAG: single-stranded DNA-binding protein, partial [Clostridiales bacterium]|nr:single-stranded DNA-binding protein [Clostridiales bacterium]
LPLNDFKIWFPKLLGRVDKLENGTIFDIRAVMGTDWLVIPKGIRLALGRVFYQHVDKGLVNNVHPHEIANTRPATYIKQSSQVR